ncbi:ATP-dependent DNA helicase [Variovorax brevis]|uniref:ATP-dependent DNA helicase n=1 Tax=Variovorax brevis TaxID=3053503 RepID=UPI002576D8C3|nr:ATP-dependent DNA helicase [Variovorax sp. J22R133]
MTTNDITVSVRSLCAFAAKAGDLDLRFTPAPSATEGAAGHRLVQMRRGAGYEAEVGLSWRGNGLHVRGRADGFDAAASRLEEIKTYRGAFEAIKPNQRALHWAQAKAYAAMLCEERALAAVSVVLVYFNLDDDTETCLQEDMDASALREQFQALCRVYLAWAGQEAARGERLTHALGTLEFPRKTFRPGQRELSMRIYQAGVARRCLLAQAPTGIGKTLASLFPLLKCKSTQRIDKIFFLTAKTSGRGVALDALKELRGATLPLRVVEIEAREAACLHPGKACHGDACPLAKGFYDRLPAARSEAAEAGWLDRASLRRIGLAHGLCPYFLAQEMVRWADVVVGDFNYYFDTSAFLYAMTREEDWQVGLLVDESHNLLERARAMYSATVATDMIDKAMALAPPRIRRALQSLQAECNRFAPGEGDYRVESEVPEPLAFAVSGVVGLMSEHFAAHPQLSTGALQEAFFEILHFARMVDSFDSHSVLEWAAATGASSDRLSVRNLIPASFLRPRFAAARCAVCFSGTLSPFEFYRDTLGLAQDTATVDIDSPFRASQLKVRLVTDLSTRQKDREGSLERLVDTIGEQFNRKPGNYLAFFSSFAYLETAAKAFAMRHSAIPAWRQTRGMRHHERADYLDRFQVGGQGVGFAVLGGVFGEGVDLPGDRLVGAFIATLGLPQHDALNELMRERMHEKFGEGYAYTYLYPGIQKVVQAAGRVIRSESDEGVVYLLDDRFARPDVARLLPKWWEPELLPLRETRPAL